LIGNTDAHLKNFAMFHAANGLRLTPSYDVVASGWYRQFDTVALGIAGARNLKLGGLQPKHLLALGQGFGLPGPAIRLAVEDIGKRLEAAKTAVSEARVGGPVLRQGLIDLMEKRWNGTFASTGLLLSKRQSSDAKHSS
jgi:serine/threonine-protein kinase HipA